MGEIYRERSKFGTYGVYLLVDELPNFVAKKTLIFIALAWLSIFWVVQLAIASGDSSQVYVRLYILKKPNMPFDAMVEAYGPPEQKYFGVKLQGHASFFVWFPEDRDTPVPPPSCQ